MGTPHNEAMGKMLRAARVAGDVSLRDAADWCGLSAVQLGEYERGVKSPASWRHLFVSIARCMCDAAYEAGRDPRGEPKSMMNNPLDRRVRCPSCGSRAGERCRDAQGDYVNWNHTVRINEAAGVLDPGRLHERLLKIETRLDELERRSPQDQKGTK